MVDGDGVGSPDASSQAVAALSRAFGSKLPVVAVLGQGVEAGSSVTQTALAVADQVKKS